MILEENRTASYIRSLYTGNTELLDTIEQGNTAGLCTDHSGGDPEPFETSVKAEETPADSGTGNGCWIFSIAHVRICTI